MMKFFVITMLVIGCSSSSRLTGLNATNAGLMGAKVAFDIYDGQHTIDLVDQAKAKGETKDQLDKERADYLVKQHEVLASFQNSFALLQTAYQANDQTSLSLLTAAVSTLRNELTLLGVKL